MRTDNGSMPTPSLSRSDFANALVDKSVLLSDLANDARVRPDVLAKVKSDGDLDHDGAISGDDEVKAAFTAIDAFDHDGNRLTVTDSPAQNAARALIEKAKAVVPNGNADDATVAACAKFLLNSPNVSFWTGLSTGSDRKNLERLANGEKARVPAKGTEVMPKLKMMQALVAMAKNGPIMINALTGGSHSPNSNHYLGIAVDLDIHRGSTSQIVAIAARFGGKRNFEQDHIHLDF